MLQEQFITERRYLKSVTPATVVWYEQAFKRFEGALDSRADAIKRIGELRERGLSPTSVNAHLRVLNTFWHWRDGSGDKCSPQCSHIKIRKLKEETKIIVSLSESQISQLVKFAPGKSVNLRRSHVAALMILDTGLRASELLGISTGDVDFENLLLKVRGKGNKHRIVPFSPELRKALWRFQQRGKVSRWLFGTRNDTPLTLRNFERDFKKLGKHCGMAGVRFSPHTLRHTFAQRYLLNGGDLFTLARILGHSSISTTQLYLRSICIEQVAGAHRQFSPLSRQR